MDISAYQHLNIRMSTRGKRPLRNLTPSDKVRAIQRIHNGETKASVSRDIGVPESTLRGWCKNEQKLRFMCRQLGAADQLTPMTGVENPPEKRPRFENLIQTPKYPHSSSFDKFGYNRLPLNGLSFPTNGSNAILEKIALNEIMKKHMMLPDSISKQPVDNISIQIAGMAGGPTSVGADYSSQVSMMQNLNLLSLLSPNITAMSHFNGLDAAKNKITFCITDKSKDNAKGNNGIINTNPNTAASLSVKNWAKDPAEKNLPNFTNQNNNFLSTTSAMNNARRINNDSNNNSLKEENSSFPLEASSDLLNFHPPLQLGLQIPNISNTSDLVGGNNTSFLEWCKVFNASLNYLALAAAAAALQTNGAISPDDGIKKELTNTEPFSDATNKPTSFFTSDLSNDSCFDSEPEDLSVRSTATSKLSSPVMSRSVSPVKSNCSFSPLQSDGE